jgi:hypothetical protein
MIIAGKCSGKYCRRVQMGCREETLTAALCK